MELHTNCIDKTLLLVSGVISHFVGNMTIDIQSKRNREITHCFRNCFDVNVIFDANDGVCIMRLSSVQ